MNTYFNDMSKTGGWVMPWQNANEGVLPDDMHLPALSEWYKTNIDRLSTKPGSTRPAGLRSTASGTRTCSPTGTS